jgi:valyl-tRNA synthetase
MIPMAGLIDKDAELARIAKALDKLEKDCARTQGKLANEKFVSNAPPAVIDKENAKLADFSMQIDKLKEQKETISNL